MSKPVLSPDCRDGNHTKCDGIGWSLDLDAHSPCQCRDLTHGADGDPHE